MYIYGCVEFFSKASVMKLLEKKTPHKPEDIYQGDHLKSGGRWLAHGRCMGKVVSGKEWVN